MPGRIDGMFDQLLAEAIQRDAIEAVAAEHRGQLAWERLVRLKALDAALEMGRINDYATVEYIKANALTIERHLKGEPDGQD